MYTMVTLILAMQLCSRFNSTLSAIRERDIPILTHYSRMEFDGLPHSLIPTLCYLQNGQWPQSWSVLPVSKSLTLVDGIQGLLSLSFHLLRACKIYDIGNNICNTL